MMKLVLSAVVSVLSGLLVAATGFSPVQGFLRWREGRRRLKWAGALFGFGGLMILAGLQLAVTDVVFQYEGQGFILWNSVLLWASLSAALGLLLLAVARWALPSPTSMLLGSFTVTPQAEAFRLVDIALATYLKAQASAREGPSERATPERSQYVH